MPKCELADAIEALEARKGSLVGDREAGEIVLEEEDLKLLWMGFELEPNDTLFHGTEFAELIFSNIVAAFGPNPLNWPPATDMLQSAWCDGLATGLLLAQKRKENEMRARHHGS